MKLIRRKNDEFELEFGLEEKGLLFHLLGMYPVAPAAHHRLTRDKKLPNQKENQQLLDDAMKSHRKANQQEIIMLVSKPGRFTDGEKSSRAVFQREEMEWLLQVINDVRIGCWIALGSPGTLQERQIQRDKSSLRTLMLMELAGEFEMFLLNVVSGRLKRSAGKS